MNPSRPSEPSRPPELAHASDLCAFVDASPTPYHAVASVAERLDAAGWQRVDLVEAWAPGRRRYVVRGGALVAWNDPPGRPTTPFRMIGAHTDSPNLRLKPRPDTTRAGLRQVGVEVYGGVLLNSWLDRDLGIAGRLAVHEGDPTGPVTEHLVRLDAPLLRIPQLAIHLDREVNDKGLVLDRQRHLAPVWGLERSGRSGLIELVAQAAGVDAGLIGGWDLMLHDLAPSVLAGADEVFVSAPRIDNLLSVHAATEALVTAGDVEEVCPLVVCFDHEEVGSTSASGAAGAFLGSVLTRIVAERGGHDTDRVRALAGSVLVSADNAHATHPNWPERHEPAHPIGLNQGPVIKINANERYASEASTIAHFARCCAVAGVPHQRFVNRTDLACGSTIGPLTAAALGVATVDVGAPQLAMHSARELAGSADPALLTAALVVHLGADRAAIT